MNIDQPTTLAAHTTKPECSPYGTPAYDTPRGAEDRTFEITVSSPYELWLVTTFTGWCGERVWASPPSPFHELHMKLTVKEQTLTEADFSWLLDHVFRLQRGSETLQSHPGKETGQGNADHPSKPTLNRLVQIAHLYLKEYDLAAIADEIPAARSRLMRRLIDNALPNIDESLDIYEAYLQLCFDCVQLTYFEEEKYSTSTVPSVPGQKG